MPDTLSPSGSSGLQATAKRACDACHRRKVKCIGDGTWKACKNCTSAGLTCTYNAIPQKKGPKGSRAKVISELRETQRQTQLAAHGNSPPHSPGHVARSGLLSMEMITSCVDYFFANLYPTLPIIHRQHVGETIGLMDSNVEAYCLVTSLCAYMMIQPHMNMPAGAIESTEDPSQSMLQRGQALLQETLHARKAYDYVESPTIWSVITSFFLFGSHFCLDKHNNAWFHLREASTLALMVGLHNEASYSIPDAAESSRRRRLYWLLFVTERAYALQQHRPLSLHATINMPTLDEDPAETVELNGFIHLINLYRPIDDTFVGLWNKVQTGCTSEWIARIQEQLSAALPLFLRTTESQAVDLRCSQQWLRAMVWQLSISHGFLSSSAEAENAMSFTFPIEISRDLLNSTSQFSHEAMEVHGVGLVEKLFDIACTLTDVMSCVPYEQHTFEYGPRDYLNQLTSLISTLRGGQQRYLPLLLSKINDAMPQMPMSGYSASIPAAIGLTRVEGLYGNSQSSAPTSGESSPFASPPLRAVAPARSYGFPTMSSGFSTPMSAPMTTAAQYADLSMPTTMGPFSDPAMHGYPGMQSGPKYEIE